MGRIAWAAVAMTVCTQALAGEQDFTVINNSGATITFIYVAADYDSGWGSDALSNVLPPGQRVLIRVDGFRSHCSFKVVIEDDAGMEAVLDPIDLCTTKTITYE
jgi:hypothetical protein